MNYRGFSVRRLEVASFSVLLAVALTCSIFKVQAVQAQEQAPLQESDRPLPADVRVEGSTAHPRLIVGDTIVLDQALTHVGRPQISPDGRFVAVTVVPAGVETAPLAQVHLYERSSGQLLDRVSGHMPRWEASGFLIRLQSSEGQAVYDLERRTLIREPQADGHDVAIQPHTPTDMQDRAVVASMSSYPQTIRVAHHPANNCREEGVSDWQVDEIPFEEYVARAVPAEVPLDWPIDALAAQAIAARTYAWYQILHERDEYDVTDWANFQMMCDRRYDRSDQAVAMTEGQYLTATGDDEQRPIIAMYSAKNGHPTLTNPAVPYLQAVPDWTAVGEARWGHGYGLSQWGAQRRGLAGHTYRQILGHYYTGVHLQNGLKPAEVAGGLLGLEPGSYLPVGGLRWQILAPARSLSTQIVVSENGPSMRADESVAAVLPVTFTERSGVWQQQLDLADGVEIQATLDISDTRQETITVNVDRTPPLSPTLLAPSESEQLTATISTGSSGGEWIGLSNEWTWQAEALQPTDGMGSVVSDPNADGGLAREARQGESTPGLWYGPYTIDLPGGHTYRALFRLRMGEHPGRTEEGLLSHRPVARLDVTDEDGGTLHGLRDVWASDFPLSTAVYSPQDRVGNDGTQIGTEKTNSADREDPRSIGSERVAQDSAGGYVEIPVDFHLFEEPDGIEFRVRWHGDVDLRYDRVRVFQLRSPEQTAFNWPLAKQISTTISAVAFDAAQNVSQVVSRTVEVVDDGPPNFERFDWPQGWQTEPLETFTATVYDLGSGLDTTRGELLLNGNPVAVEFSDPDDPWATQQVSAVLPEISDGEHSLQFRIFDQVGHVQEGPLYVLRLDRSGPDVSARVLLADGTNVEESERWFRDPVQVELLAEDPASGVSGVAYVLEGEMPVETSFYYYEEPFILVGEGMHHVRYWGRDIAGNYSSSQNFHVGVDRSPPTATIYISASSQNRLIVGWSVEDTLSGVETYTVEVRRDEDDWESVPPEALLDETHAELYLEEEEQASLRIRATDRMGNESDWIQRTVRLLDNWIYLPAVQASPE